MMFVDYTEINQARGNEIFFALTEWYGKNKRDLPFRKSKEPYCIWISEIMAQQTRITALVPYYERFMERFPDIASLAESGIDDVLKAWEGLGYYARAHNLHKCAQIIVKEWGGEFPSDEKKLKSLPGIGDYTSAAILSISFDKPYPAVDGNVLRVFARLESNEMDIALPATKKILTDYLKKIMPRTNAGIANQSLMELGALICTPQNPACHACPLDNLCTGHIQRRQKELPIKSRKKTVRHLNKTILIIVNCDGQVLVQKRREKLLHGLWQFYSIDKKMRPPEIKEHLTQMGYTCEKVVPIGGASHVFTHLIWDMEGYECHVAEYFATEGYTFIEQKMIPALAFPSALRFYTDFILKH